MLADALEALGGEHYVFGGKGLQGWRESVDVFDEDGYRLGRVYHGQRTDVQVLATSEAADRVRPRVRQVAGARTSRVDTRVDTFTPFDALADLLQEASMSYGSVVTRMESTVRGESTGRTIYLGAPSSAVRVRVYEKWLQAPETHGHLEGLNRVEVQLRPPSRVKASVSGWTPAQTFCASKVARGLAERLGADLEDPVSLHVARGTPDLERSLEWMGRHYGGAVETWLTRSGGDVGRVLDYLTGRAQIDRRA